MTFKDLCESAGYDVRSYSGRGMYGAKCIGIDVDRGVQLGSVIADLVQTAIDCQDNDGNGTDRSLTDMVCDALRHMRSDSMGLGMIYYFPNVEWEDPEEDEGDHND